MALLTIPFIGVSLLEHAAGGAILAKGGSYIAGTYVGPAVAQAFTTASSVLGSMAAASGAAASVPPAVAAGLTLAVVAGGAYCYFHGLPGPLEAALAKAGLGASAEKGLVIGAVAKGFAVPVASLAVTLVLLGGAGYVHYRIYSSRKAARAAAQGFILIDGEAQAPSEYAFGHDAWNSFGSALWSGLGGAVDRAAQLAHEAVQVVTEAGSTAAERASGAASTAYDAAQELGRSGATLLDRLVAFFRRKVRT